MLVNGLRDDHMSPFKRPWLITSSTCHTESQNYSQSNRYVTHVSWPSKSDYADLSG